MKVSKNSVVAISYELMVDGGLADKAVAEKPLEYIHGTGMLLPRFEEELEGKEQGDDFAFVLSPEEGYGVHNPEYVFDLPIEAFAIDGEVRREQRSAQRQIFPIWKTVLSVLTSAFLTLPDTFLTQGQLSTAIQLLRKLRLFFLATRLL